MTAGCLPTSACLRSAACCVLALFLVSLHMANRRLATFCVLVWCSVWAPLSPAPSVGVEVPLDGTQLSGLISVTGAHTAP